MQRSAIIPATVLCHGVYGFRDRLIALMMTRILLASAMRAGLAGSTDVAQPVVDDFQRAQGDDGDHVEGLTDAPAAADGAMPALCAAILVDRGEAGQHGGLHGRAVSEFRQQADQDGCRALADAGRRAPSAAGSRSQ